MSGADGHAHAVGGGRLGVIVGGDASLAAARCGGLTLLARQVHTLRSAGCRAVVWLDAPADAPAEVAGVSLGRALEPHAEAMVVRLDVVAHRSVAPRLAHERGAGPGVTVAGDEVAGYLAVVGDAAGAVDALRAGRLPEGCASLPLLEGISPEFVLPGRTEHERARAHDRLLRTLMKPTSGYFERLYMRPLSRHFTAALVDTAVTPNQVTVVTTLLGLLSAVLVARGDSTGALAGGALHMFMRVVDCIDGELSRLRYQGTKLGSWLDPIGDAIGMASFILAVSMVLSARGDGRAVYGYASVVCFLGVQVFQWWGSSMAQTHGSFQSVEWGHRARERTAVESLVGSIELLVRTDAISTYYGLAVMAGLYGPLAVGNAIAAGLGAVYFATQVGKLRARLRARA